jgi:hypothetical protein
MQKIINKKMEEHKAEIESAQEVTKALQEKLKKQGKPSLEGLHQLAMCKDKVLFHRAALIVLGDLLKEVKND